MTDIFGNTDFASAMFAYRSLSGLGEAVLCLPLNFNKTAIMSPGCLTPPVPAIKSGVAPDHQILGVANITPCTGNLEKLAWWDVCLSA